MVLINNLNIFNKTRYSLTEEDRVVNGLLILLQYSNAKIGQAFLRFIGSPVDNRDTLQFREHVPYAPESIVDGEILVKEKLLIAIEAKIKKNQLDISDQPVRYLKLLNEKPQTSKILLLLTPDINVPNTAKQVPNQSSDCFIQWRSWQGLWGFLKLQRDLLGEESNLSIFLLDQYLDYLESLGLKPESQENSNKDMTLEPKLHFLFGNIAIEKILLHIYHHGGGHINSISRDHSLGRGATQRTLKRLVEAGIIKKETHGRVIWYTFNEQSPILNPILELIRIIYGAIPEEEKKNTFQPSYKI